MVTHHGVSVDVRDVTIYAGSRERAVLSTVRRTQPPWSLPSSDFVPEYLRYNYNPHHPVASPTLD
jgi:hypothetical protein